MSRLIPSEELATASMPVAALNLCDIEAKVQQAIERARDEARRILTEAVARAREAERVAAARGEKAGFDAGMAKGIEEGRRQGLQAETERVREATATVREAMIELIGQVDAQRHEVIADAKHGLLTLAVAIAERICRAQVCRSGDHLRPLVDEVIDATGSRSAMVLRVNPQDTAAIESFLADIHAATNGGETAAIRVVPDEGVERGGCIGERQAGKADGRISTQIDRLVSELLGVEVVQVADDGTET